MVPNGNAADDSLAHTKKFRINIIKNKNAGNAALNKSDNLIIVN